MKIKVWSGFKKKDNSTKTPDTAGKEINVLLKEECSKRMPVFELSEPMPNYDYVQAFGNYYFITDVVNISATQCEIYCDIDVLASYKADILSYTAFVERSASNYDVFINDPLLTQRQMIVNEEVAVTSLNNYFSRTGCYIIEVLNKYDGVAFYLIEDLRALNKLFQPATYTTQDVQTWIESKIAQAFDLDVYIGTVKWIPFDASALGAPVSIMYVGPLGITPEAQVYKLGTTYRAWMTTLELAETGLFNDFRDTNDSYTEYMVSLPGVGFVPLSADFVGACIHNNREIYINILCDLVSGDITYDIETFLSGRYLPYAQFKGVVGVDAPIAKSSGDPVQTICTYVSGLTGAGGGIAGGGAAGAVSAAGAIFTSDLQAISNNIRPQVSITGGSQNKADLWRHAENIILSRRQFGSKDFPQTVAGRPLFKNVSLSTLSGFVKCGGASVPISGDETERTKLNGYLNSGFYIE